MFPFRDLVAYLTTSAFTLAFKNHPFETFQCTQLTAFSESKFIPLGEMYKLSPFHKWETNIQTKYSCAAQ